MELPPEKSSVDAVGLGRGGRLAGRMGEWGVGAAVEVDAIAGAGDDLFAFDRTPREADARGEKFAVGFDQAIGRALAGLNDGDTGVARGEEQVRHAAVLFG